MRPRNSLLLFFLGIGSCGLIFAQGQKEAESQSRDLANMFYTDTLPPRPEAPAATLPSKPGPPAKKAERRVGLKYRLWHLTGCDTCRNCDNIDVQEVPTSNTFHSGDRLRLFFESNVDGFLYVLQKGSTGKDKILFPDPKVSPENRIKRGVPYAFPSGKWLVFDNNPGEERLIVVVSKTPLKSLPAIFSSQEDQTGTVLSVISELNQSVKPRDLVLFQENASPATPPSTPAPSSRPVAAPLSQAMIVINTSSEENNAAYVEIRLRHQ